MFILPFDSPAITLVNAGGKGLGLSRLDRGSFRVPKGFILTTAAYQAFVAANGLDQYILDRLRAADPSPARASDEIRAHFAPGRIPGDVSAALLHAYEELSRQTGRPDAPVAVRSSATAEDLPGLSFAGQQDTMLNVIGADALTAAVKQCWASLWNDRALAYRAEQGIPPGSVALAVVVQLLVPADVSGVLFTANPVTGNRDEIVIEATTGLGEAIVSGQVDPDSYTVDAARGSIIEKMIGEKGLAIVPRAEGGTAQIHPTGGTQPALTDAQVIELARLGARIAAHFGAPQDIEWAMARGEIFILQSRNITTLG